MACTWSSSSSWCSRSRPECGPGLETGGTVLTSGGALPVTKRAEAPALAARGVRARRPHARAATALRAARAWARRSRRRARRVVGGVGGGRVRRTVCAASVPTRVRVRTRVGLHSPDSSCLRIFDRMSSSPWPGRRTLVGAPMAPASPLRADTPSLTPSTRHHGQQKFRRRELDSPPLTSSVYRDAR
jgi:hypothetical protein